MAELYKDRGRYLSFYSGGGVIELQLSKDVTSVISKERLYLWANDLEKAFFSYYGLTSFKPYDRVVVEAYKKLPYKNYAAYVFDNVNVIYAAPDFLYKDLAKMAARENDWNFCILHEMGHLFDTHRGWNFESELLTDLKLAYVLETNGAAASPSEFDAGRCFAGADIKYAYKELGAYFPKGYNVYSYTYRFLQIKEAIGWDSFKICFAHIGEHNEEYLSLTRQGRAEAFAALLTRISGKNVKAYFTDSEWKAMLEAIK